MTKAKYLMLQGTGSDVGKSVLAAGFCRQYVNKGFNVAPFKSQNMALNSYITLEGGEIGRAQAVQAMAAKADISAHMNPVLLKPVSDETSQVIIQGKVFDSLSASNYMYSTDKLWPYVEESLNALSRNHDLIIIEGGGSPAEVNLRDYDIVNMKIAKHLKAPVVLVADIDCGGVFASIVGTLELLEPDEVELIKGIIINKFRGDLQKLQPGLDEIERITGVPIIGVMPYIEDYSLPQEDSLFLQRVNKASTVSDNIDIAVIKLPRISNFTDFDALAMEEQVSLRYVRDGDSLGNPDLLIIPGSKNTIEDLMHLKNTGREKEIKEAYASGIPIIGVCGGYQILGHSISDPDGTESKLPHIEGIGLLPVKTIFKGNKITARVKAVLEEQGTEVTGYEIHMGRTELFPHAKPFSKITVRNSKKVDLVDGAYSEDGLVFGTYLHGIFDNDNFRHRLLKSLSKGKKGNHVFSENKISYEVELEKSFNLLATEMNKHLDMELIDEIVWERN